MVSKSGMKAFAILIISIMFFWSGVNKITNFNKKVETLTKKTNWPSLLCQIGMVGVIILELLGFVLLIEYYYKIQFLLKIFKNIIAPERLIQLILLTIILFIITVTLIYHPLNFARPIPFLTNLTILGAFIYIYADLF